MRLRHRRVPESSAGAWVSLPLLLGLGFVSGAIALAYEVLWTRELLNLLGSTTRASALVLAAFMAGLALGAYAAGHWTIRAVHPLRLFAAAEGALGGVGLVLPVVLYHAAIRIGIGAVLDAALLALLLGPAFLMGIALPSLAAALQQQGRIHPKYVAVLYGLNTLGGAAAAFGVGLIALPGLGLAASTRAVAAASVLLAALAWALSAGARPSLPKTGTAAPAGASDLPFGAGARMALLVALLLSGTAALGYEVLWTRTLVLVAGSSSTAFALMLGFYLLGLALGGFAMSRFAGWAANPAQTFRLLQLAIAATALLGAAIFPWLPSAALFGYAQFGTTPASILAVNILLIAAIILPPTACIGASFPIAACLLQGNRPRRGREVGLALSLTTAGNVAGILLAAFAVIPAVGLQRGVAALAILNAVAALVLWLATRRRGGKPRYAVPTAVLGVTVAAVFLPPWDIAVMTSGVFRQAPVYLALLGRAGRLERAFSAYETRYYREGTEAVVAVFDRPTLQGAPHRVLTIDGKVDASMGADMATQVLSGHLPFLFHPEAERALVIGLASGVTVGALAKHPLDRIEVVEIEPAVVEASHAFDSVSETPLRDPRVHLTIADGRRYLSRPGSSFDIIVSEPSNPWLSMSARLFTREFFTLMSGRLRPEGVLVQWIPLYGLSASQFQALLRTLLDVFQEAALFRVGEGDLVAVARTRPLRLDPDSLFGLFSGKASSQLQSIGIGEPAGLLTQWTADGEGLRAVLDSGPLNTDDNGLLEFGSPWYLLSDTRQENEPLIAEAARNSRVAERIVTSSLSLAGGTKMLDRLALLHLEEGRLHMLRALAASLRLKGHTDQADLYTGDALAVEGRWSEADSIWARHRGSDFWLRRARAAFSAGSPEAAAVLFAKVSAEQRSAEDDIWYALALARIGRHQEAIRLLADRSFPANTAPEAVAPFLRFAFLKRQGKAKHAQTELQRFETSLDDLRRCLEVEGCQNAVDRLVRWGEGGFSGIEPDSAEVFKQALFLRITRPLPRYFDGVRSLWLGERNAASRSFRTYLNLLPEPDPRSKAHALLAKAAVAIDGKWSLFRPD